MDGGFTWLIGMTWLGLGKVWKGISWLIRMTWLGLGKVWRGFSWLVGMTWLGLGKLWKGISWLTRMTWLGLGKVLGRLSLRLKMWLGLGLIGIMVLALTWQTTIVYTEWGITRVLGIPEWTEEKFSQFVVQVAHPMKTWLVGIPGLIALGTVAGLLAFRSLGLERIWKGVTWLMGMAWPRLGIMLGRLFLRQRTLLVLGSMGIVVIALALQGSIVNTEWGITWLPSIPGWVGEKSSFFKDLVALPLITWFAGIPGLITLGTTAGLLAILTLRLGKFLGLLARVAPRRRRKDGAERKSIAPRLRGAGRRVHNPRRSSLQGRQ